MGAGLLLALGTPAGAAQGGGGAPEQRGTVEVAKASGYLDEVLVDFLSDRIDAAQRDGLVALVIQLNSRGATVSDERIVELAQQMRRSTVPIAVWVGPSGAQARGAAAQLVGIASPGGLAAAAWVGRAGPQILPPEQFGTLWGNQAARLETGTVRGSTEDADDVEGARTGQTHRCWWTSWASWRGWRCARAARQRRRRRAISGCRT